jgi:hypothetical protein
MNTHSAPLNFGRILLFWLPLAATWLMMSLEGPFISAVIARLSEPKNNLAAYGVAFSLALMVEAPIIMIMSASTAMVRNQQSFLIMKKFVLWMNIAITAIMALLLIKPVFHLIAGRMIGLPPHLELLTWTGCLVMLPWPAAIGYRRFYQGVLIRHNRTRFVAYGTVIRLLVMGSTALLLALATSVPGAIIGGAALAAGVVAEAVISRLMSSEVIRENLSSPDHDEPALTMKKIWTFYYPLALTTILALGVRPMVTFFMGQSSMALESLAVFPVVHALTFLFICLGLSYQEVVIALAGDSHDNTPPLRNFALVLAAGTSCGLGLITFTPLSNLWFVSVSGLTPELASFSNLPARILTLIPALWVLLSFQRGILVKRGTTGPITQGTAAQVLTILLVLGVTIHVLEWVGIVSAALALLCGGVVSCAYLFPWFLRVNAPSSGPVADSAPDSVLSEGR